jgi:hypothetical protein
MSSCTSDDGYESSSCDSLESFSSSATSESKYTDNDAEPGTLPVTSHVDYSSESSDEEPQRRQVWGTYDPSRYDTESVSRAIEFWSWLCSRQLRQLDLERASRIWEAKYNRTQDRRLEIPVIFPPSVLSTKICTQNTTFLCAPPAGLQSLLGISFASCCTFVYFRMFPCCFPFDRGKADFCVQALRELVFVFVCTQDLRIYVWVCLRDLYEGD